MKSKIAQAFSFVFILLLLSGCLFPKSELAENQIPYEDQLRTVQEAIDQYRENTNGLVPIRTKEADTPIFEKYLIDFEQLKVENLLSSLPGNSFERGGVYQYVLVDPEDKAEVKLIDLRVTEEVRSLYFKLDIYRDKHLYPPFGKEVSDGLYEIDYEKLKLKEAAYVTSPYSELPLPIVMDVNGDLYVDYRKDLTLALDEFDHSYKEGDDIRYLLTDHYPFVPVHSLPYTIKDGEAVFANFD